MNKRYIVRLASEERARLEAMVSKGKASVRKVLRAQVLLKVDADGPNCSDERAAEAIGVHPNTVRDVRERFVLEGFDAALNRKKASRPPVEPILDGAKEARMIAVACSEPPAGRTRWTLRLLANRLVELQVVEHISHETVRRALKKTS